MSSLKAKLLEMLKSDAVPRAPRPETAPAEPVNEPAEVVSENGDYNNIQEDNLTEPDFPKKQTKKSQFKKAFFSPGKKKKKDNNTPHKSGKDEVEINTQATGDVINIVNSKDIHWGAHTVYYMGTNGKPRHNSEPEEEMIEKNNLITLLLESKISPEHEYIDYISKNLGRNWHSIFRTLGYTKGRIETMEMEQAKHGISEARYKLLLDWSRNDDDGTLGRLATLLWDEGERQVVKELSIIYHKNRKL